MFMPEYYLVPESTDNSDLDLDWDKLVYGEYSREEVRKAVNHYEWQLLRCWLKGKHPVVVYKNLAKYLEYCNYSHMAKVQVSNYIHMRVIAGFPYKGRHWK